MVFSFIGATFLVYGIIMKKVLNNMLKPAPVHHTASANAERAAAR